MTDTRREFLRSAVLGAVAAGGLRAGAAEAQVPKMKFGGVEISRLVAGCNPFYGYAHFNNILGAVMKDYYTQDRVVEVLRRCEQFGINAHNCILSGRAQQDLERFRAEGGKMHLILQGVGDPAAQYKLIQPLAIYHHGENTDKAYQAGDMQSVREWCRKARDTGAMVGVGTHKPEVLAMVEEQGWDVDFYAGCVYNRTRTAEEWKQALHGESLEMPGETYLRSDPPRMYRFMRQTNKPCFAFKILAAGRVADSGVEQAFRTAFESIKPSDGVFIGLFPRVKDEVRENAERVRRILAGG